MMSFAPQAQASSQKEVQEETNYDLQQYIMNKETLWKLCCGAVVVVAILTFTPVITPAGQYKPQLMGMPYTLWMGILQAIVLVGITYLGTLVHPGRKND